MNAPMIVPMTEQGTEAWAKERAGHCTASRFKDVLARIKVGEAASRRNYRTQIVCERLTGIPTNGYVSKNMEWGIKTEPLARIAYEAMTGEPVIETGFHHHPTIEWLGASPDGCISSDGVFEAKCPAPQTHLEYLLDGALPSEYVAQVQGQMWILGRKWADFVSFDPRYPKHLQLMVVRVQRDDAYIAELEKAVVVFLAEVAQLHSRLMNGGALAKAA